MENLSIYIHIPFCRSKCVYCDFTSFSDKEGLEEDYISAVVSETRASAAEFSEYMVQTLYFGGGTPTVLCEGIINILDTVREKYNISPDAEITVEANPDTVTLERLALLRGAGVNRLSIGVQTFNDVHLARLNRAHTAESARRSFAAAREAGFENIGLDLMFSVPGQSTPDFNESIREVINLRPEHVSCYGMTVEPSTPLGAEGYEPDEEADRQMYHAARGAFAVAGYEHYELSNFALPGKRSRHNMVYWTGGDYRGFGLSAHSFISGTRFRNEEDFFRYVKNPEARCEVLETSAADRMAEFMFLGLRLVEGVGYDDFLGRFGRNIEDVYGGEIGELVGLGLVEEARRRGRCGASCHSAPALRLTVKGMDLANRVFERFLFPA